MESGDYAYQHHCSIPTSGLLAEWNERLGVLMAEVDRHCATQVRHFQAGSSFQLFNRDRHRKKL